jgi:hypothetical protein
LCSSWRRWRVCGVAQLLDPLFQVKAQVQQLIKREIVRHSHNVPDCLLGFVGSVHAIAPIPNLA